jgi:hypothetical protein
VQDKHYQFITFRPLLFGGNFPDVGPEFRYAGLKKKRELEQLKVKWLAEKQRREQRVAEATKTQRKKERLYVANTTRHNSAGSDPLLLGD